MGANASLAIPAESPRQVTTSCSSFQRVHFQKRTPLILEAPEAHISNSICDPREEPRDSFPTISDSKHFEISFEYQFCRSSNAEDRQKESCLFRQKHESPPSTRFAFSGAAMSANATLANSRINDDGDPVVDSPHAFVPLARAGSDTSECITISRSSSDSSTKLMSFRSVPAMAIEDASLSPIGTLRTAGGPAGEDRLQAVCSEEDGWLYCGIYDGFNGRDAADYVAANLYNNMAESMRALELRTRGMQAAELSSKVSLSIKQCLRSSVLKTEAEFFKTVEMELCRRPELPMIGCCLMSILIHDDDLFTVNVGDSRAVLATNILPGGKVECVSAVQLTKDHSLSNKRELRRLEAEHPGEEVVKKNRVKGKLKVTRAFGAGYLKEAKFNDPLPKMFRVSDLRSPPYISSEPNVTARKIRPEDRFVIAGSDGLFDFFSNEELVRVVSGYLRINPKGDPAKFLVERIVHRAAKKAGISVEMLKSIPQGERRKYHDDVTVFYISLQSGDRSSASTRL